MEEQIKNAPFTYFAVVGILLAVAFYMNASGPDAYLNQVNTINAKIKELDIKIKENEKIVANRAEYEQEMNRFIALFDQVITFLPEKQNQPELIRILTGEAKKSGVKMLLVKPDPKTVQKTFYEELKIDVVIEGSYGQLTSFLSNVTNMQRLVLLRGTNISFSRIFGNIPILELKGSLIAFRYTGEPEPEQNPKNNKARARK